LRSSLSTKQWVFRHLERWKVFNLGLGLAFIPALDEDWLGCCPLLSNQMRPVTSRPPDQTCGALVLPAALVAVDVELTVLDSTVSPARATIRLTARARRLSGRIKYDHVAPLQARRGHKPTCWQHPVPGVNVGNKRSSVSRMVPGSGLSCKSKPTQLKLPMSNQQGIHILPVVILELVILPRAEGGQERVDGREQPDRGRGEQRGRKEQDRASRRTVRQGRQDNQANICS